MKFLVLFGIAFAILKVEARPQYSITKDTPDFLLETIHQAVSCAKENGLGAAELPQEEIEGILPEDNESFNIYFGCIWKKKGIINDDAEVDPSNLRRYLVDLFTLCEEITPQVTSLVDTVMGDCADVQGKDYGQKAVKINNCVLTHLYELVEHKH